MKYCVLTELDLLTDSIEEQILALVNNYPEKLNLTSTYNNSAPPDKLNHKYIEFVSGQEELDLYWNYRNKIDSHYSGLKPLDFNIFQLPSELEAEIFNRLPDKIKNMKRPPYVRMQTLLNGDYLWPHRDTDRSVVLITPLSNNPETTWFWKQTEPHPFAIRTFPDIDRIKKVSCAVAGKGETWLFDVSTIHSVEREPNRCSDVRITINIGWSLTTMDDVLRELI